MKNEPLPKTFSDQWVKEFIKALACPTFKFTRAKEPSPIKLHSNKQQSNVEFILNLTKE